MIEIESRRYYAAGWVRWVGKVERGLRLRDT
jgi:hypothetical protein